MNTSLPVNSDQCNIHVEELDGSDDVVDKFSFIYDISQDIPQADFELHEKPIVPLLIQMKTLHDDVKK